MANILGETSSQIGPCPIAQKPLARRTPPVVGVADKDSVAYGIVRAAYWNVGKGSEKTPTRMI
jgi:hypothetical protein